MAPFFKMPLSDHAEYGSAVPGKPSGPSGTAMITYFMFLTASTNFLPSS